VETEVAPEVEEETEVEIHNQLLVETEVPTSPTPKFNLIEIAFNKDYL
jgi:hypothetical protein